MDANQHVNNVKYIGWILEVTFTLAFLIFNVIASFDGEFVPFSSRGEQDKEIHTLACIVCVITLLSISQFIEHFIFSLSNK